MNTIMISKNKIEKDGGVVVLSLKEYQKIRTSSAPTYYLRGKEAKNLDRLVKRGLRNYKNGKSKLIKSLADFD